MNCAGSFAGIGGWLIVASMAFAQATRSSVAAPEEGAFDPVPAIAQDSIPRDQLLKMDQAELGPLLQTVDPDRLLKAHELIENYFSAARAAERKSVISALEELHLPAGIVGRITRLRLHWPALQPNVYYVNQKRGPHTIRYFVGVPADYDRSRAWPLVIKLASSSAFLTDPAPDASRVAEMYRAWIKDDLAHHPDAIVLMPLLNIENFYGPSFAGMNSVIEPMIDVGDRINIDPARVYLIGHSAAASAVWNLALHYPTYFASVLPLAGAVPYDWQRLRLSNLSNMSVVAWNDLDDKQVRIELVRSLVNLMHAQKLNVDYLQTKGIGHNPTDAIVEERYQKMRAAAGKLYPPRAAIESNRPETQFNRNDWLQIWQEVSPGTDRRLGFRDGGFMVLHEHSARIEATHTGNNFELTVQNVESLRVFLNDQMVDFTKPLSITVNKKKKKEGYLKESLDEMLKDQLLLGRGWRYYTAAFDLDLIEPPATRPATRPTTRQE